MIIIIIIIIIIITIIIIVFIKNNKASAVPLFTINMRYKTNQDEKIQLTT